MTSLDATAGEKKWPERVDIRIDIDPKSPDIIKMDCTDLKFKDGYFDEIFFHPPFNVRSSWLGRFGGNWKAWASFIEKSESEFYRCLSSGGVLMINVDEGRSYGMARYDDLLWFYLASGRWIVEEDEKTNVKRPFGNKFRHIITFSKA